MILAHSILPLLITFAFCLVIYQSISRKNDGMIMSLNTNRPLAAGLYSQYRSPKPEYQNLQRVDEPPANSVAVFEWERFDVLSDYTDRSLLEVCKKISRDIIERPYHYDKHHLFNASGKKIDVITFNQAGNHSAPSKIPNIAVYKQNHGTGHALRQMVFVQALIDAMAIKGNEKVQALIHIIKNNTEFCSIIKLAAFCMRIGRTLDYERDSSCERQPIIYTKRSSEIFAKITIELGFNKNLVQIVSLSMLEYTDPSYRPLVPLPDLEGIDAHELLDFCMRVLMAAHRGDLVRIFNVKKQLIDQELRPYLDQKNLREVCDGLVIMAAKANQQTGNAVVTQDCDVKTCDLDGRRLVEVTKNLKGTFDQLRKLSI